MRGARPERRLEALVAAALEPGPGEPVLVACSGGPDSAALAALTAASLAPGRLVLGHVNHGIREGAWQDEAVVLALGVALRARVACRAVRPAGDSEAALRSARYEALGDLARTAGARRILTAHHAEDQTETVLLALFRGTGLTGLGGMQPERPLAADLTLCRPLLRVRRDDLVAYVRREQLPYVRDASNADRRYRRNALREALEPLREAFPRLDEAIARCAEIVRDAGADGRAHVRAQLRRTLAQEPGGARDVTFERLDAAARWIEAGGSGRVFITDGVEVARGKKRPRA